MEFILRIELLFKYCFQQFHQTKFLAYCLFNFTGALSCYFLLLLLKKSTNRVISGSLRKFFFISAEKSETNAIQVGGIPFSLISLLSLGLLFHWFPYLINQSQSKILVSASLSWIGILIYGYIDDFFEIRPIVKLSFQFIIASIFSMSVANSVFPNDSAYAFVIILFISVGALNGTNLIDGLDTLSYKVSSVIYFSFIILAAPVNNLPALFIATSCFFIMTAFYFFNREPSKIHLGEVGVSCLGFSYIVLAALTLNSYMSYNPVIYASSKAILPLVFSFNELGISFLRRTLNSKSPLKGDRLHVHHILLDAYNFKASHSASIIATMYLVIMMISLMVTDKYNSLIAISICSLLTVSWSMAIGFKYWFKNEIKINIFNSLLVKKDINIISANTLSDFRIIIEKNKNDDQKMN